MKTTATKLTVRLFFSRLKDVPGLAWRHLTAPPCLSYQQQLIRYMGDNFISWADMHFSNEDRRTESISLKELYGKFLESYPEHSKYTPPSAFRYKIKKYCEWKGFNFKPLFFDAKLGRAFSYEDITKEYQQNNIVNVITE